MKEKRGQTTVFVIVAIVILIFGILIFYFWPSISLNLGIGSQNPNEYMQNCLEDSLKKIVQNISMQGGTISPEHYFLYKDSKLDYLCYQDEYYLPCVVQRPLLIQHIKSEIKEEINSEFDSCFSSMTENFEKKGYLINIKKSELEVELLPKRIVLSANTTGTISKGESETYKDVRVVLNNNIYELATIANSITSMESKYGDSEVTDYMSLYRDLKVEKYKQSDGTTVYVITDRNNLNKFQFASRSVAWPPGYGNS